MPGSWGRSSCIRNAFPLYCGCRHLHRFLTSLGVIWRKPTRMIINCSRTKMFFLSKLCCYICHCMIKILTIKNFSTSKIMLIDKFCKTKFNMGCLLFTLYGKTIIMRQSSTTSIELSPLIFLIELVIKQNSNSYTLCSIVYSITSVHTIYAMIL